MINKRKLSFEYGKVTENPTSYLWHGDCLELMKDIPNESVDAIICDLQVVLFKR